jgi:serine/threonine protein kinase
LPKPATVSMEGAMPRTVTGTESAGTPETMSLLGQLLADKYRVKYQLGQGGMATVWAGVNERTGKRVALKVIRSNLMATPGAESFLQSEGLAASRINHPNVVTVFDVIEHEGMACIVMELLDGEPLGSYIARRGPLSVAEATSLLLPAMRGVAAAHAMGVIHRDLKPQNIFICIGPDGRIASTKVLDFGISIIVEQTRENTDGKMPGLVGTPSYMSPEHLEGDKPIDERTDVYGFGVLLYEALTGRQPFPGEPNLELLRRVLCEPAPPVLGLRPDLPAGIVRIIETAMAKNPDERYPRLDPMMSAIEDEIMPATLPPPRVPTPLGGVPASVLAQTPSSPMPAAPSGPLSAEPSGQHQDTMLFYSAPLGGDAGVGGAGGPTDWDERIKAVSLMQTTGGRSLTPATGTPNLSVFGAWNTASTIVPDEDLPRTSRAWRILAVVAIALAIIFVIRTAISVNRSVRASSNAASATPTARPVVAPPTPVVPAVPAVTPKIEPTVPAAPASATAATPEPAPVEPPGPATSETPRPVPDHPKLEPRRRVARSAASAPRPATRPPAVVDKPPHPVGSQGKAATPRAGHLSTDDF